MFKSLFKMGGVANKIYPVGSIYMSVNSTNPSELFGGTWELLKDKFLLGAGDTYSAGSTGGAANVTLNVNQIPSHGHTGLFWAGSASYRTTLNDAINGGSGFGILHDFAQARSTNNFTVGNTGGSQSHNNMPPYLTVYIWKRTA